MARNSTARELKERCRTIRDTLRAHDLATEEEVAEYWPGGSGNPDKSQWGWIHCYANYVRLSGRMESRSSRGSGAKADKEVLDALRSEPIAVPLANADPDCPPIFVYAKSLDALMHLHSLDVTCGYLTMQRANIIRNPTAEGIACLPKIMSVLAYTQQLLCWIVTTEGPGMPYRSDDPTPQAPDHIANLSSWDVLRICRAHQSHMARLAALTSLISERSEHEDGGIRPSWSVFVGSLALETGESPGVLMKQRALVELLAMTRLGSAARAPTD